MVYAQNESELKIEGGIVLYSVLGVSPVHIGIDQTCSQFNGGYLKIGLERGHHLRGQLINYDGSRYGIWDEGWSDFNYKGWIASLGYEYEYRIWKCLSGHVGWEYFYHRIQQEGESYDAFSKPPRRTIDDRWVIDGARMPLGINIELFDFIRISAEYYIGIAKMKGRIGHDGSIIREGQSRSDQSLGLVTMGIRI